MDANELLTLGPWRLDLAGRRLLGPRATVPLTAMEARLLDHLGRRPGEVQTPDALLTAVWGYRPGVRSKAVALTISRLRRKLGEEGEALIETAPGGGYRVQDARGSEPSLDRLDLLRAESGRSGAALRELHALQPAIERALARPRPPEEQARLWLARAVSACQRQIHLSAVPLWTLAETLASGHLAVTCALWAGRLVGVGGPAPAAISALEPWLARCPTDPAGRCLRVELLLTLGNHAVRAGRHAEARAWAEEGLALADQLGDTALGAHVLGLLGRIDFFEGRREQGHQRLLDAVALLNAAGELATAARLEQNLGVQLYMLGALEPAEAALLHAASALDALESPLDATLARINLGTVLLASAEPGRALELARTSLQFYLGEVDLGGETMARLLEGRALLAVERLAEARQALERAALLARRLGMRRQQSAALRYLCWIQRRRGDLSSARAFGQEAAALLFQDESVARRHLELWSGELPLSDLRGEPEEPTPGPNWLDAELTRRLKILEPSADQGW